MKKTPFLVAVILVISLLSFNSNAQSIVDPGVSVWNYKHPNKAAKAKAGKEGQNTIKVANLNTAERYNKRQGNRYVSNTPKYAPRPSSLVVYREYQVEGIEINPLVSPRNYKTPTNAGTKDTSQLADYHNGSDKTVYPTVD
jgi:hypothetical protein